MNDERELDANYYDGNDEFEADLEYQRLENQSPSEWWEEDFLPTLQDSAQAVAALSKLISSGCEEGRVLDDLREIGQLTFPFGVRDRPITRLTQAQVRRLAERTRKLARLYDELDRSTALFLLPRDHVRSDQLRQTALALDALLPLNSRTDFIDLRTKAIHRLTLYVNQTIRRRRGVGKVAADAALTVLLNTVTDSKRTPHAQRVARARLLKRLGNKEVTVRKPKEAIRARGSRSAHRRSKVVPINPAHLDQMGTLAKERGKGRN